jgi:hypothetical protein
MGFCVQLVQSGRIGQYPSLIDSQCLQYESEEEAPRQLHLAIRLRARDLAKPGRGSEGRVGSNRSHRERTIGRLKVCMVDDIEGIDPELEVQCLMYLEVLGD